MEDFKFRLSDVGEGIHEAEIVRWLVQDNDFVTEFQPLVEIQTDKAVVEITSPRTGRIQAIKARVGEIVHVGQVLVEYVHTQDEVVPIPVNSISAESAQTVREGSVVTSRVLAAPATRKLARALGMNLADIQGTGPNGRITKEDVLSVSRTPVVDAPVEQLQTAVKQTPVVEQQEGQQVRRIPLTGIRRIIAEHMVKSKFTAPHVTAFDDCDAANLLMLRKKLIDHLRHTDPSARLTYLPFFIKAVTVALKEFSVFNAHFDDNANELIEYHEINIGIAVDTEDGLIVPVLRSPDKMSLLQIQTETDRLAARARAKELSIKELKGSTFTISNIGALGGTYATPILNYPEVAILATHKIEDRPVARNGQVVVRPMLTLSMSFDHRVIDGAKGVRFMNRLKMYLEDPDLLWL